MGCQASRLTYHSNRPSHPASNSQCFILLGIAKFIIIISLNINKSINFFFFGKSQVIVIKILIDISIRIILGYPHTN